MEQEMVNELLDKLKRGDISEHLVKKEEFLVFREILVKRKDFKHFRGIGQRGGDIIFQYQEVARS